VLVLDIDLKGGTLVRAELPIYPLVKGESQPVVLFNRDSAATNYVLQSGLAGKGSDDARPSHLAKFAGAQDKYTLAPGQQELRVPLTWTDGAGVTVTKTFIFKRSDFAIGLEYQVVNAGTSPWVMHSYARIVRTDAPVERSMFKVDSFSFRGPAYWGPAPNKAGGDNTYHKIPIEDAHKKKLPAGVENGWLAGLQHHFVSAIVPDPKKKYDFSLDVNDRQFILGAFGPAESVAPGASAVVKETLFVGPKLQSQLQALNPDLDRVADYGLLTLLSRPLFLLLNFLHSLANNWGLAIILATFLLKLAFYPLSEKAGRSMARMRTLAPRMKALQETYKDDRTKLGQATMELYKTEKVNPLAGCLPMLIQMPVFLAFYWVLLESVEMRQAPFFGWINDLSSRDPFFILPALNGLAMWAQYKLNPPPPDPMQAKIFQFMPIVFSVMFALFPAGLVLYWVTNTGLSILQQWNINRKIAEEDKARKK
jgi:YidC/Oxa1 family membrane protein insertase